MKTYYICTNDELVFSGQEDSSGEAILCEVAPNVEIRPLEDYCEENNLNYECNSTFQDWQGGRMSAGSTGLISVGRYSEKDDHQLELERLYAKQIEEAIEFYNRSLAE